jgi:hypothetical protein
VWSFLNNRTKNYIRPGRLFFFSKPGFVIVLFILVDLLSAAWRANPKRKSAHFGRSELESSVAGQ